MHAAGPLDCLLQSTYSISMLLAAIVLKIFGTILSIPKQGPPIRPVNVFPTDAVHNTQRRP